MHKTDDCRCSRRAFLRNSLATGAGLATLGGVGSLLRLARAQSQPDTPDRYYVFAYFTGVWDILLGLDPRDPARYNDGTLISTLIQPGYDRIGNAGVMPIEVTASNGNRILLGPFAGALAPHIDRVAIVRGMSMETLTHEVGRRRFITGKAPSGLQARGSSSSTWLAGRLGAEEAIPNLSVRVETYNKDLPNFATGLQVNQITDLLRALRPSDPALAALPLRQVDALLSDAAACDQASASGFWRDADDNRGKARSMTGSGLSDVFDFAANTPEMAELREFFGFNQNQLGGSSAQAALAAQALVTGVSRCVSIQVTDSLDTHFDDWETDQGPRQQAGFEAVARLADRLAATEYRGTGSSWLDHTTIVGFSEFSRTALLNTRGGRDHSLTNACFALGADVRGGQVIGQSSNVGMTPMAVDLRTGRVDRAGVVPKPEHVWQSLFDAAGVGSEPDLRVPALHALLRS